MGAFLSRTRLFLQLAILRLKTTKNCCESRGSTNEEYVLTPLEDAQNAAEAFMHKEVEILYKISLLEKDDAEKFKRWVRADPRYQRMQNFKSDVRTYMGL